jgi:hypothetical protein
MRRRHQLLQMMFVDNGLLDDLGVFDGGFELGECAIEQAELVEGVLADQPSMPPALAAWEFVHGLMLAYGDDGAADNTRARLYLAQRGCRR